MKNNNKKTKWYIEFALDGTRIFYKNGLPHKQVMPNGKTTYFQLY